MANKSPFSGFSHFSILALKCQPPSGLHAPLFTQRSPLTPPRFCHISAKPFCSSRRPQGKAHGAYQGDSGRVEWVKSTAFALILGVKKNVQLIKVERTWLAPPVQQEVCVSMSLPYFPVCFLESDQDSLTCPRAAFAPCFTVPSISPALPNTQLFSSPLKLLLVLLNMI